MSSSMWRLAAGAMLLAALAAGPVRADVIEVGDDGAARVRSGSGEVAWRTVAPGVTAASEDAPAVPDTALTEILAPDAPAAWTALLTKVAEAYRVSPNLLAALVRQESGWRTGAMSSKGALGLAQLMPATARSLAVDARDPASNLAGGARYLREMLDRFDGDVERALAAYNAGPGRVQRAGGVPRLAETQAYVTSIMARLDAVPQSEKVVR